MPQQVFWDMIQFQAHELSYAYGYLSRASVIVDHAGENVTLAAYDVRDLRDLFSHVSEQCRKLNLVVARSHADRALSEINTNSTYADARRETSHLRNELHKDLKDKLYFLVPPEDSAYYGALNAFGDDVSSKLVAVSGEIERAGNCIALDLPTAAVFHLMRVVEYALQQFGLKLGLFLAPQQNWQKIINDLKSKLESLPERTPEEKKYRERCWTAHAHLSAVKYAWRNDVMHPKESYQPKEAKDVYGHVKLFLIELADLL